MQKKTNPSIQPVQIGFVLFDQFSNLCLANCLEPLRAANRLSGRDVFSWVIYTLPGTAVQSSSGMQVLPHAALPALETCDYLYVLASYNHLDHDTPATRSALRGAVRKAGRVVGFDAAPWLMASAGLLTGRRASLHWDLLDSFSERFLDVRAERARIVRDDPWITCAGAMSALDLSLDQIETYAGAMARHDVEALFIYGDDQSKDQDPSRAAHDPLIRRALTLMQTNLETPLSLAQLSQKLTCQSRTLTRRFHSQLGAAPGAVYRHLRLSAARKLLEGGHLSIAEIAIRCGYDAPTALTRAFRQAYGITPSQLRKVQHPRRRGASD